MDAITLLKADHRTVNELFKKYEGLGDRAMKTKQSTVDKMIRELSIHTSIEETIFYPYIREHASDLNDSVLEALEEHLVAKWELDALEGMDPTHERFDAKVTVLIESVRHHVKEEERSLFPKVRQQLTRAELVELGEALQRAKRSAPTHPHPRSPDTPPANVVGTAAEALLDKARDVGKDVADRVREHV